MITMVRRTAVTALAVIGGVVGASLTLAQDAGGPQVQVLSSQPAMVTGGDALIKITGATSPLVSVGTTDVSAVFRSDSKGAWIGLVGGLREGDNTLTVKAAAGGPATTLTLTNHAINATLFAGPQQTPYLCEDEAFNLGPAKDSSCTADTVVRYSYLTKTDSKWKDFDPKGARPTDIAETVVGANQHVPMIVRIETGVINRAGYAISMLYDPAAGPAPSPLDQGIDKGWNGKLIYAFGGGVQAAFHMGKATGLNATNTGSSIMNDNLIKLGYALASATLDRAGGNNNDVTAAETVAKVKEHFIEEFGPPVYTLGYGPSGGATLQNLTANNYPGLFDGAIPERLFPDTMTFQQPLYDCELLTNYFANSDRPWTDAQKTAVAGTSTFGYCTSNGTRYPTARPENCDAAVIADPTMKANPPRCTYQDNLVNVFGKDPATGFARNPFDDTGVQFGLAAFNQGQIGFDDFVDLNRKIGGLDQNGKVVQARQVGDPIALEAAYETGRVNEGGAGMASIPILDIRTWHELAAAPDPNIANVDVHDSVPSKIMRDRMVRSNGNADNMVSVSVVEVATKGEGTPIQLVELKYLTYLDQWITAIQHDSRPLTQAQKISSDRPVEMANACFPTEWLRVTDMSECGSIFPIATSPRMAAGGPSTDDIFKCQLKAVTAADYRAKLTPDQLVILRDVFPDGVCDYTKPGVGQVPLAGTWLTYPHQPVGTATVASVTLPPLGTDQTARVLEAQQRLVSWGYDAGAPDGILGPKTRAAVIAFQKAKGLTQSGLVSDDVLAALRSTH